MSFWAVGISAAVTIGTTAYTSSQNKKAAKKQRNAMQRLPSGAELTDGLEYEPIDVMAIAREAAGFNAGEGTDLAIGMASRINSRAVSDVEEALARLFGGGNAFNSQRDATNSAVNTWLRGDLSESTRASLGRQALETGAADLGPGSVSDLYAGYLGLTTEQIVGQGVDAYRSLYQLYRSSVPLVSGAELLPFTTLAPGAAVQSELYNELNRSNAALSAAQLGYAADYAQVSGDIGYAQQVAQANNEMAGAIASGIGSIAGAYFSTPTTAPGGYYYTPQTGSTPVMRAQDPYSGQPINYSRATVAPSRSPYYPTV